MDPEEQRLYRELSESEQGLRTARKAWIVLLIASVALCSILAKNHASRGFHHQQQVTLLPVDSLPSQKTAFHFQPRSNWMNDPNGPLYYKGYYHLFYQYNPYGALWGNIAWGHAISRDLIHWEHMDLAMHPDNWYDQQGVWSGSATTLPDGRIIMLYTGSTNDSVQVQNMAVPLNLSDPLLTHWVKAPQNPILTPPPGIGVKDFRDPTTAWLEPDGFWRISIGARRGTTGLALIYRTRDFVTWELEDGYLHEVPGTGMWECVDFYPISGAGGLDTSQLQNDLAKYVLKASLDDDKHDYYAVGVYSQHTHSWTPDVAGNDVGLALRYDYGKYYASKSFFDPSKNRRILWGWANESDSVQDDINKGWSSVQTLPRALQLDMSTGNTLIQWPVEEVESLRYQKTTLSNLVLAPGDVVEVGEEPLGSQLDIEVEFEYPEASNLEPHQEPEVYDCSQGGSSHRGVLGPFGLLVLAEEALQERTAIYFYMALTQGGSWETRVCSDQSRSSLEPDLDRTVYGAVVKKSPGEELLKLRVIVDHSIVETFAQEGRACITSRVYPTLALDTNARVFLFNNGTQPVVMRNLSSWKMHATRLSIISPQNHQIL